MRRPTKRVINSDRPSEDKGYNRYHSQTEGGEQAYARGEQPISYWSKAHLYAEIVKVLYKMRSSQDQPKLHKLIKTYNLAFGEILQQLRRTKLDKMKELFLEYKGYHYTGNYYRYTHFYGLKDVDGIVKGLRQILEPKPQAVQLHFIPIEQLG